MTLMWRTHFRWSGGPVGSGVTTLYGDTQATGNQFVNAAHAFMLGAFTQTTQGEYLPSDITITQDALLESVESTTGKLQSVTQAVVQGPIAGAYGGAFAAPAGATVEWDTGQYHNGHRVIGRTFLVPLASSCFQFDGTLLDSYRQHLITTAANYISSGGRPLVYSRPKVKGGTDGVNWLVTACQVRDKAAILRSRR